MTVWRTERRYGDEPEPDEWEESQAPRRRRSSPRDRFATPMPISPALPPVAVPPAARPPSGGRHGELPPGRHGEPPSGRHGGPPRQRHGEQRHGEPPTGGRHVEPRGPRPAGRVDARAGFPTGRTPIDRYDTGTVLEPEILPPGAPVPGPRTAGAPLPARVEPGRWGVVERTGGSAADLPSYRPPRSRFDWRVTRHAARPLEVVDDRPRYLATFGWTTAWFAVPFALFAAWSLTFPGDPGTACARPTANMCMSPRSHALQMLIQSMPRVAAALCIALVIAGLVRLGSAAWRPVTVGFSAAIIGAGAATVLYSVLAA